MNKISIVFFPILFLLLTGCNSKSVNNLDQFNCFEYPITESEENLVMPEAFIDLRISLVENNKNYAVGDVIPLYIENTSDHTIWFSFDQNIAIWEIIDENNWIKIDNQMNYDLVDDMILKPMGSNDAKNLIFIQPSIHGNNKTKEIFVVLWGYRYESGLYCEDRHAGRLTIQIYPIE